jgi:hypothetical protein
MDLYILDPVTVQRCIWLHQDTSVHKRGMELSQFYPIGRQNRRFLAYGPPPLTFEAPRQILPQWPRSHSAAYADNAFSNPVQ